MPSGHTAAARAALEHLSDTDLGLLGRDQPPGGRRAILSGDPAGLTRALADPVLAATLFGPGADDGLSDASPFLCFAVAVHRCQQELATATHVPEWLAPGRRTPVFDVAELRDFLADPWRRLFLAELLASYTHVASGSVVVATRRGLRRQRFSELDPVRLAGLLEVVPEAERPGVLRRLGDLSLLLTGVFPDAVGRRGFGPVEEARLRRAGGRLEPAGTRPPDQLPGAVGLLEQLGRRSYRTAAALIGTRVGTAAVLDDLADRFGPARRILGLVTDRFLFGHRQRFFGIG